MFCFVPFFFLFFLAGSDTPTFSGEAGEQLCLDCVCHHGAGGIGQVTGSQPGHPGVGQTAFAEELHISALTYSTHPQTHTHNGKKEKWPTPYAHKQHHIYKMQRVVLTHHSLSTTFVGC